MNKGLASIVPIMIMTMMSASLAASHANSVSYHRSSSQSDRGFYDGGGGGTASQTYSYEMVAASGGGGTVGSGGAGSGGEIGIIQRTAEKEEVNNDNEGHVFPIKEVKGTTWVNRITNMLHSFFGSVLEALK